MYRTKRCARAVFLVGSCVSVWAFGVVADVAPAAAEEARLIRSSGNWTTDPVSLEGLWVDQDIMFRSDSDRRRRMEETQLRWRAAYGYAGVESAVVVPYRFVETEAAGVDRDSRESGDMQLHGKYALKFGTLNVAPGLILTMPTGDKDAGFGAGEVGYTPFGSAGGNWGALQLSGFVGYRFFGNPADALGGATDVEGLDYGANVAFPFRQLLNVRLEFSAFDPDVDSSAARYELRPGLDLYWDLNGADMWLRPNGSVGLSEDAADWGVGVALAVTYGAASGAPK